MKKKLFKHLLNVTTGAACAAILMVSSLPENLGMDTDNKQSPAFQEDFSQWTTVNELEVSPLNDMDDPEFHKD